MSRILQGIRVLDLSRHVAAPYCGLLLADMGAEVIRVDDPKGDDDRKIGYPSPIEDGYVYLARGRNKKGITVNLSSERGRDIFGRLLEVSDVVLESYTIGAMEALGVDYQSLRRINPSIILVSITAFGINGPYASRPGFDLVAQAYCGAMSMTGFPGNPPTASRVGWVDYSTGTHAALGAVSALYHRAQTGVGQMVEVSLLDTAFNLMMLHWYPGEYKVLGIEHEQRGNRGPTWAYGDLFKTKDGWVFFFMGGRQSLWRRFVKAIGREDLENKPGFRTDWERGHNAEALDQIISEWIDDKTADDVIRLMEEARVPCAKVLSVAEAVNDPQVKTRATTLDIEYPGVGSIPAPGVLIKFSETPGKIDRPAPKLGEHNEEVYCGLLGLRKEDVEELTKSGVI